MKQMNAWMSWDFILFERIDNKKYNDLSSGMI